MLLEGDDEWIRVGEAICSNSENLLKNSLRIDLYPLLYLFLIIFDFYYVGPCGTRRFNVMVE